MKKCQCRRWATLNGPILPAMCRKRVDFPQPFGPARPVPRHHSPGLGRRTVAQAVCQRQRRVVEQRATGHRNAKVLHFDVDVVRVRFAIVFCENRQ